MSEREGEQEPDKYHHDEMGAMEMEEFEAEDEDGPLLVQPGSVDRKNIRTWIPGRRILHRNRRAYLIIVLVASVVLLFSLLAGVSLLFAGDSLKAALRNGSSLPDFMVPHPLIGSPMKDGNSTLLEMGQGYIKAIISPENTDFARLGCPAPTSDRYAYMQESTTKLEQVTRPRFFFALDLHQCIHVLPRLMGSIVEAMRFLGPESCALSVVEGRSDDGTYEVLKLLKEEVEQMGAKYFLATNDINPGKENNLQRINALAELRNIALQPLVDDAEQYDANVTVIFLNDVAICMEDILELIHQRQYQQADMTCAMDWTYLGPHPTFYDVWIARTMNGDSFFNIPPDGNWGSAWNLFWNNPTARDRQQSGLPFQVFSCWNGAVAFTPKPLIEGKLKFRSSHESECFQGEPSIFAKEMWYHGYGKIAVIPSVNLEYSDKAGKKIKAEKGYVSKWVNADNKDKDMKIEWDPVPPPNVKCIPTYENQTWPPWDEGLPETSR
ncbi:hypothetical protein G7Y79_00053g088370 [Physcia stellaris]|nr:hypothetical protein G7Y79_00053g088370 [Physcia stellaris]